MEKRFKLCSWLVNVPFKWQVCTGMVYVAAVLITRVILDSTTWIYTATLLTLGFLFVVPAILVALAVIGMLAFREYREYGAEYDHIMDVGKKTIVGQLGSVVLMIAVFVVTRWMM